jgi:aminoglycoside phosphotransferase (APT) family kinase protein
LPEPLRALAGDAETLLRELRGSTTLVHGDAWPGNVLRTPGGQRCWIDWEEAGAGHPALDLANWLHGSPWVPPARDPERDLAVYLAARTTDVDESELRAAVDAAVVLLFLLLDLPGLAGRDERARREIVDRRTATAVRIAAR